MFFVGETPKKAIVFLSFPARLPNEAGITRSTSNFSRSFFDCKGISKNLVGLHYHYILIRGKQASPSSNPWSDDLMLCLYEPKQSQLGYLVKGLPKKTAIFFKKITMFFKMIEMFLKKVSTFF